MTFFAITFLAGVLTMATPCFPDPAVVRRTPMHRSAEVAYRC